MFSAVRILDLKLCSRPEFCSIPVCPSPHLRRRHARAPPRPTSASPRRPRQLPPAQHVNVKMVDALRPVLPVVHNDAEALRALLLSHALCHVHQVAQDLLLILAGVAQPREPVALLGDDEHVHRRLGVDVACGGKERVRNLIPKVDGRSATCQRALTEGQRQLVFVDFVRRPLSASG